MTDDNDDNQTSDAEGSSGPDPDDLARLEKDIRQARSDAEEVIEGVGTDREEENKEENKEEFVDSGEDPEDDDQTIAPG